MSRFCSIFLLFPLCALPPARAADPPLPERARMILEQYCHQCHGKAGSAKGGFDYVLDRDRLLARNKVVPGKADQSELLQRILAGDMPPRGKPRPTEADVKLLHEWVAAGAPLPPAPQRPFVGPAELERAIWADLQSIPARQRKFIRYISFSHLATAGRPEAELRATQAALAKLLNSLSWHPEIRTPQPVREGAAVYRIDLREYRWTARTWERLVTVYPYRTAHITAEARRSATDAGTEVFVLRGDWLVATASRGKLYYDILELPVTDRALERLLQADVARGIVEETALRAGFNGSGVARNNRVLERHDAAFGAYWRSYDFSENTFRQNVFDFPLGPASGRASFKAAGGEIIFHLPNGMLGFFLVDGAGRRVEKGPVDVVSDPQRPDKQVEVGVSCMNCHGPGLLPKEDQVRAHADKNPAAFTREELETIRALYVAPERFRTAQDRDNKRYLAALQQAGVDVKEPDPVLAVTLRYEAVIDVAGAASELGMPADLLAKRIDPASATLRVLGPLQARGGTIQRQVFEEAFPRVAEELNKHRVSVEVARKSDLPAAFAGHTEAVLSVAVMPDGKWALSAGQDQSVRLWKVKTGEQLRVLEGHTAVVRAVAISPDGKIGLSGGDDRTVRAWDLATGQEMTRMKGHLDRVRAVALMPDGKRAISAGDDRTVRIWDMQRGTELQVFTGHVASVTCMASSADGRRVLSGDRNGTLCLWNAANGQELKRWDAHRRGVLAVAFSPDGKQAVSSGEDRVVRLWQPSTGKSIRELDGHANAVLFVAFSSDGTQVFTGSGQNEADDRFLRTWETATGKPLAAIGGPARVWCLAFTADGSQVLTGGSDRTLRVWSLKP